MSSAPDNPDTFANGDLVAQLAGLAPDSAVSALRAFRADATRYTQGSHDALFSTDVTDLTLRERLLAAWYAALLSNAEQAARDYRERLLALATADATPDAASDATTDAAADARANPHAALLDTIEQQRALPSSESARLESRVAAILRHTEALVLHPAATAQPALASLQAAGLTTRAIVALSQLVAFVTYQVRVVAALRALETTA